MSFGAGLVVLGMMLNSLVSGDAVLTINPRANSYEKIENWLLSKPYVLNVLYFGSLGWI